MSRSLKELTDVAQRLKSVSGQLADTVEELGRYVRWESDGQQIDPQGFMDVRTRLARQLTILTPLIDSVPRDDDVSSFTQTESIKLIGAIECVLSEAYSPKDVAGVLPLAQQLSDRWVSFSRTMNNRLEEQGDRARGAARNFSLLADEVNSGLQRMKPLSEEIKVVRREVIESRAETPGAGDLGIKLEQVAGAISNYARYGGDVSMRLLPDAQRAFDPLVESLFQSAMNLQAAIEQDWDPASGPSDLVESSEFGSLTETRLNEALKEVESFRDNLEAQAKSLRGGEMTISAGYLGL